ncbi:LiaI-LiaF-like domain-containing protein [Amphibacillus sp. Q70]|uniref:LiaI-LiaF-like domain-containing protein n=1 Tax=Amphibacillus sp. Q70 TaxID=3453416 RepID=UPI003F8561C0
MRKQNYLTAYILIGAGLYFLLQQWHIPFLSNFSTWPTLLILLGVSLLIHSYLSRDYDKLFPGVILLGLGVHFHAVAIYPNWVEHWSIYAIIIGLAFLIRYQKTKVGLYPGLIILFIGLFMLLSITNSQFSQSVHQFISLLENYWPIGLIVFGVYLLFKRK